MQDRVSQEGVQENMELIKQIIKKLKPKVLDLMRTEIPCILEQIRKQESKSEKTKTPLQVQAPKQLKGAQKNQQFKQSQAQSQNLILNQLLDQFSMIEQKKSNRDQKNQDIEKFTTSIKTRIQNLEHQYNKIKKKIKYLLIQNKQIPQRKQRERLRPQNEKSVTEELDFSKQKQRSEKPQIKKEQINRKDFHQRKNCKASKRYGGES